MRFEEYTGNEVDNPNAKLAILNPFRYRSYYYDSETNLYYLNSRYYDPELGRFINADDISVLDVTKSELNGLNLYCYCLNNPVNDFDENGCWSWKSFWKIIGCIVLVAVVTAVSVATAGAFAAVLGASTAVISAVATGAAIGGLVAGTFEIINQATTFGIENMNVGSVAIETIAGAAFGALTGAGSVTTSSSVRIATRTGKVAVSGISTLLHGINEGKSAQVVAKDIITSIIIASSIQGLFGITDYTNKVTTPEGMLKLRGLERLIYGLAEMSTTAGVRGASSIWNFIRNQIKG